MKATDQVLTMHGVDTGLAANRAIDLSEKGGWQLDDSDPAPKNAGDETGEIADDAAAERQDDIAAFNLGIEQ